MEKLIKAKETSVIIGLFCPRDQKYDLGVWMTFLKRKKIQELTDFIIQADPTAKIKFTIEVEKDVKLPILDTLILPEKMVRSRQMCQI